MSAAPATPAVRRATESDVGRALELYRELEDHQGAWRVFAPREGSERETEARYRRALEDPDLALVVCEKDGAVAAIGYGEIGPGSSMSDELSLSISNVVVARDRRGRGLGRAVVMALVAWGRSRGVERAHVRVFAENAEAIRFWERLGMRPRLVQLTGRLADLGG
jgi:ribosomal protein S18 acetylase RimI-like enzyme